MGRVKKPQWEERLDVGSVDGFRELTAWLPAGWEDNFRATGAFTRSRKVRGPMELLRLILAYPMLKLSLPALSRWAAQEGVANIAFPSLWERLQLSRESLRWLVAKLCEESIGALPPGLTWCPLDATTFSIPGSSGRDWLVNMAWSSGTAVQAWVAKGGAGGKGESFRHWEGLSANTVLIGDRAYGSAPGLYSLHSRQNLFVSRFVFSNLPLYITRDSNEKLQPQSWVEGLAPGQIAEREVWIRPANGEPFPVRVLAIAKTAEEAEKARRKARKLSERKGHTPDKQSLFLAGYILLVTNLSRKQASASVIAMAYRWRWQIERAFRRLKSGTSVRRLPCQNAVSAEVYLLSLLVAWLLAHRIAREGFFFPWGCPIAPDGSERPRQS